MALSVSVVLGAAAAATVVARQYAVEEQEREVEQIARNVLDRNDDLIDKQLLAFEDLKATGDEFGPCSEENLAVMRRWDLQDEYAQGFAALDGTTVACSSLGLPPIDLGTAPIVGKLGAKTRVDVSLPDAPGVAFNVVELHQYAVFVNPAVVLSVPVEGDVGVGTYSMATGTLISSSGLVDPSWAEVEVPHGEVRTFTSGDRLVTVNSSERWLSGAIASIPASETDERTWAMARWFIPAGLLVGILLAAGIAYLGQLQVSLRAVMRGAFRHDEFYVLYQPAVDLATGRWLAAEVLVRWRRAGTEKISADIFVPQLESVGMGRQLTARVLDLVRADARDLFREHPEFRLGVNLTRDDLLAEDTPELLRAFRDDLRAGPGTLCVEATEHSFLDTERARPVVAALQDLGLLVVVDDFGTGYANFSYLEKLRFDGLKIDKLFIESVGTGAPNSTVAFQIARMAQDLGLYLVAEGVEREEQAEALRQLGVQVAQGWLYAKPMSYADLMAGLRAQNAADGAPHPTF